MYDALRNLAQALADDPAVSDDTKAAAVALSHAVNEEVAALLDSV